MARVLSQEHNSRAAVVFESRAQQPCGLSQEHDSENRRGIHSRAVSTPGGEREFFIDNLLVRIHFIIEMIWWTGLAPWEFTFPFPSSLISTFLTPSG